MPHINRIRVNNVKYNFGTQYYDDFVLRMAGKNTIYDLANGGGKSVLMLLLLQNMLPNCTLDEKQPIEKLFRSNNNNTVIHSLIEWRLNDGDVKDGYKYMTTGFCAKRASKDETEGQNGQKDTASVEYFNYCIFYREFNDNDIVNLPLSSATERITYNGLKSYLKDLEKRDYGLEVKVFERKGEYQNFIGRYGIYESEWEIIRGINKTEGHVRTYFETNYRTTRKVVEDMFISEIIRKSFNSKISDDGGEYHDDLMAQTLLDIKDKLMELSKKKSDIKNYDRQIEVLCGFAGQISGLGTAYSAMEDSENMLVRVYNSIRNISDEEDLERARLADRKMELLSNLNEAKRQTDTVKLCIEEKKAEALVDELKLYEEKIADREKFVSDIASDLKQKESANDYLDYIYYRGERDKLRETIENAMKDKGELFKKLSYIAAQIKALKEREEESLEKDICAKQAFIQKEKEAFENAKNKERELDRELAVLSSRQLLADENEEDYKKKISSLWGKTTLLFGADIKTEYNRYLSRAADLEKELSKLNEKEAKLREMLIIARLEYETISNDISEKSRDMEAEISQVEAQKESKKRIDAMKGAYGGVRDIGELLKELDKNYISIISHELSLKNTKDELEGLLKSYKEGIVCVPDSAEKIRVKDYIERCYGYGVTDGGEYLLGKSEDEREELLSVFPLLAFGLVIKEGILQLVDDEELMPEKLYDYPVPIFDGQSLESGNYRRTEQEKVFFVSASTYKWYMDESVREKEIRKTETLLKETVEAMERSKAQEALLREDKEFVLEYRSVYGARGEEAWEKYEKAKAGLDGLKAEKQELLERIAKYETEEIKVKEDLQALFARKNALSEETAVLKEMMSYSDNVLSLLPIRREIEEKKTVIERRHDSMLIEIEKADCGIKEAEEQLDGLTQRVRQLRSDWALLYRPFYRENQAAENINTVKISYDKATAEFDGVKNAFDMQFGGLDDKYQLLNNYEAAMNKALQTLAYNGADEKDLNEAFERHELYRTDNAALIEIRERLNKNRNEIKRLQKEAELKRDEKNRIEGGISHGIKVITEKYGSYEEINVEAEKAAEFVVSCERKIEETEKELVGIEEQFAAIEKNGRSLEIMKNDLERIFKTDGIKVKSAEPVFEDLDNITQAYQDYTKGYEKFRRDILARREDFERGRRRLSETLSRLEAYSLVKEINESMNCPMSFEETEKLKADIKETAACIELEKERVVRGVSDMQTLKDNFENQCLQTCANIRLELEKLSKLSTIRMDDEEISIISLKVPYVKEEFQKDRMEKYLDELVVHADSIKDTSERLKYIQNGLAWKKLFSVIVTDMDAIRLNLYKRERIKEQSRYLRYEEAVGSTGQSQGIYIQFLIGVINYISNINSQNAAGGIKNVIFIDNPFGAAKDIYIWEPIFKLLKTNNVQLIVPARGVTPAITGRFDVNYVLGQNMVNGRLQTVVVDYFSSIERDELEYKSLNYEQAVLQFD